MGQAAKKPAEEMVAAEAPAGAIMFVARAALRPALRASLQAAAAGAIETPETSDGCVEAMMRRPEALLVVDWDHGLQTVTATLHAAQGSFNVDTRPIFLIASEVSPALVATAAEFYVGRVHTGELTRGAISDHLEALLGVDRSFRALREPMAQVADARRRGDWATAGRMLSALQAKHPDDRRVTCELVENLIHENRWPEASALADSLAVTDSLNLRVRHFRARCMMRAGQFDEAAALLGECQLVNPFNPERLVDLGSALLNAAKYAAAKVQFDAALAIAPDHAGARDGQRQCRLLEGDVNAALTLLRELSGPREVASLFNNAAILAIRHQRFPHGLSLYRTALGALGEKEALSARLFFNLGLAHLKQGDAKEALACFQRASTIDPTFENAQHNVDALSGRRAKKPQSVDAALTDDLTEEKFHTP